MKKASGICLYNGKTNQIINFTINHKGNNIPLIDYSKEINKGYKYNTFSELFKSLLQVAKNNNYTFGYYMQFDCKWYDISFVDMNEPNYKIEKFGYWRE